MPTLLRACPQTTSSFTPKGLCPIAQGCDAVATLGKTPSNNSTPKGLSRSYISDVMTQPLRGRYLDWPFTQGRRFASTLGLWDTTALRLFIWRSYLWTRPKKLALAERKDLGNDGLGEPLSTTPAFGHPSLKQTVSQL